MAATPPQPASGLSPALPTASPTELLATFVDIWPATFTDFQARRGATVQMLDRLGFCLDGGTSVELFLGAFLLEHSGSPNPARADAVEAIQKLRSHFRNTAFAWLQTAVEDPNSPIFQWKASVLDDARITFLVKAQAAQVILMTAALDAANRYLRTCFEKGMGAPLPPADRKVKPKYQYFYKKLILNQDYAKFTWTVVFYTIVVGDDLPNTRPLDFFVRCPHTYPTSIGALQASALHRVADELLQIGDGIPDVDIQKFLAWHSALVPFLH